MIADVPADLAGVFDRLDQLREDVAVCDDGGALEVDDAEYFLGEAFAAFESLRGWSLYGERPDVTSQREDAHGYLADRQAEGFEALGELAVIWLEDPDDAGPIYESETYGPSRDAVPTQSRLVAFAILADTEQPDDAGGWTRRTWRRLEEGSGRDEVDPATIEPRRRWVRSESEAMRDALVRGARARDLGDVAATYGEAVAIGTIEPRTAADELLENAELLDMADEAPRLLKVMRSSVAAAQANALTLTQRLEVLT